MLESRALVESKARQMLARALLRSGPLTGRALARDTGLSLLCSHYHLRVLATAGVVRPLLTGTARSDAVAWALAPERLPTEERELLLGEVCDDRPGPLGDLDPEWARRWFERPPEKSDRPGPRKDDAE